MSTVAISHPAAPAPGWRQGVVVVVLALPWLAPFAPGPSANVVPWLFTAALAICAFLLAAPAAVPRRWLLATAALLLYVLLRPAALPLDRMALAGAGALVLLALALGRGRLVADGPGVAGLLATAWVVAALASSVIALLQYFDLAGALQPWLHPGAAGEAIGNLRQPNQLASLTAIGLAGLLWWAGRGARLAWLLPALALLAVANAATTSRTGLLHWLALFALAGVWGGQARRLRLALVATGLAVYALALVLLPLLLERVTGTAADTLFARVGSDLGCSSRRVLWSNVLHLIAQKPLTGWGWGELDYAHFSTLYRGERFCDILDNAHNLPLHVAVELGLPAALLLGAAVAIAVWRARPWRQADDDRRLAWSVLVVLALHSLLEYPLWYGPFQLALGLALGLLAAPRDGGLSFISRRTAVAAAAGGLALLAYAGWDYLRVSQVYLPPQQRLAPWREDTLEQAGRSWLFAGQARFAEVTLAPLTRDNARWMDQAAQEMLHYSPEPRVIEKVIESATMMERYDEAVLHLARYRAAFPQDYARWRQAQKRPMQAGPGPAPP